MVKLFHTTLWSWLWVSRRRLSTRWNSQVGAFHLCQPISDAAEECFQLMTHICTKLLKLSNLWFKSWLIEEGAPSVLCTDELSMCMLWFRVWLSVVYNQRTSSLLFHEEIATLTKIRTWTMNLITSIRMPLRMLTSRLRCRQLWRPKALQSSRNANWLRSFQTKTRFMSNRAPSLHHHLSIRSNSTLYGTMIAILSVLCLRNLIFLMKRKK